MEKTMKITKAQKYAAIKEMIETGVCPLDTDVIVEFCDQEIAALARKAEKSKENAAKKRSEGDELTEVVFSVLTAEPATIADITAAIGDEAVTPSKVQYRLSQLAKDGRAVKSEIVIPASEGVKARKVVGYALAD